MKYLSMFRLEAQQTVGLAVYGNVLVAGQRTITLVTAEMFEMPDLVFCAGVFHSEDQLVTSRAAGNVGLGGVVTGTVHVSGLIIV